MGSVSKIKNTPIISLLVVLGFVLVFAGMFNIQPKEVSEAQSTDCSGAYVSMYGTSGTTGFITEVANISVGLSTSSGQAPAKIILLLNGHEVGQARPEANNQYSWFMQIPAKLLDPMSTGYEVRAIVKYSTYECQTPPFFSQPVMPPAPTEFLLVPNVTTLSIPVNNSAIVSAAINVPGYTANYAQFALFDWFTESRGSITPTQNRQTSFFAGPTTGEGRIKAVARYGFRVSDMAITTKISNPNSPITGDDSTTTTTTSTTTNQTITSSNTNTSSIADASTDVVETNDTTKIIETTTSIQNNDSTTKPCAIAAVGEDRFNAINNGTSRPNLEELSKLKACFARINYILPSNFAPVAPGDVSKLQLGNQVKIEKPINVTKASDNGETQAIKLSGKAKPNSTVIIYIYSEPMVLTTTANENGEWQYELENPLEPGDHTMYAVVDRGDGTYERTDPVDFVIGSAEATAENPAGLSLILDEQASAADSSLTTYLYVISSGVLLAAILLVVVVAYRHGKHTNSDVISKTEGIIQLGNGPAIQEIKPTSTEQQEPQSNQVAVNTELLQPQKDQQTPEEHQIEPDSAVATQTAVAIEPQTDSQQQTTQEANLTGDIVQPPNDEKQA